MTGLGELILGRFAITSPASLERFTIYLDKIANEIYIIMLFSNRAL